jgi:putative Mg2+ transporter-C (MgtC) family protein
MFTEYEIVIRLALAAVLCGVIGLERELRHKPAGLRTNILVGVGSALIALTSLYLGDQPGVDPTRIAAGIITGVGFLGAGLIIRDREGIHGTTTASVVWIDAAIGLAAGVGFYTGAIVSTLIVLATLLFSDDVATDAFRAMFRRGRR